MGVATWVMRRRRGDLTPGQVFGDRVQPVPGGELAEYPLHDWCGGVVDGERVQAFAVGCLGRVGVRTHVDQPIAVWRATAQEAPFELGLRRHRGSDPDLDPVPFTLRDATEHGHDQVVCLVLRVSRAADFLHPQRHAKVGDDRESVTDLVAVERALRLTHHDGIEAAPRVGQRR